MKNLSFTLLFSLVGALGACAAESSDSLGPGPVQPGGGSGNTAAGGSTNSGGAATGGAATGGAAQGGSGATGGAAQGGSGATGGAQGGTGAGGSGAGGSGATGGTGAGGSGAGGSGATGGTGTCTPPGGTGTCDTWTQCGCPSGQMCQIRAVSGESSCYAAGATAPYNACAGSAGCQAGFDCVSGTCQQYCDTAADCSSSFDSCNGVTSGGTAIPGFTTCSRTCNPVNAQDSSSPFFPCGAGLSCVPNGTSSSCITAGSITHHGSCVGTGMGDPFLCAAGTMCLSNSGVGDAFICLQVCDAPGTTNHPACPGSESCYGFQTPFTVAGQEFGVCDT